MHSACSSGDGRIFSRIYLQFHVFHQIDSQCEMLPVSKSLQNYRILAFFLHFYLVFGFLCTVVESYLIVEVLEMGVSARLRNLEERYITLLFLQTFIV